MRAPLTPRSHTGAGWGPAGIRSPGLAPRLRQGWTPPPVMESTYHKLASYPRQNGLVVALRELGRIERTLFALEWLQNTELRGRVHVGLNKGEARNALVRAVFFNRLGELRDRSFENQKHRASGLNLVVAAIVLWNTVYLERAVNSLMAHGYSVDEKLLQHLSPLGLAERRPGHAEPAVL